MLVGEIKDFVNEGYRMECDEVPESKNNCFRSWCRTVSLFASSEDQQEGLTSELFAQILCCCVCQSFLAGMCNSWWDVGLCRLHWCSRCWKRAPYIYELRDLTENGWRLMLCHEQKSVALRKNRTQKFSKLGDLVLDSSMGMFSIAKSWLFLDKNRRFVWCGKNSSCVETSMAERLKVYASQLLDGNSEMKGGTD